MPAARDGAGLKTMNFRGKRPWIKRTIPSAADSGAKKGAQPTGEERWESDEPKAQRMVAAMLQEAGWKEAELERRLKGDVKKGRRAARLRAETTTCLPCLGGLTDRPAAGR